jgi:hypothetical protein
MSAVHTDISYPLIAGIFAVLDGNVTYSGVTYPVHKSMPKAPGMTYVHICNVVQDEDGTKDTFIYAGTVQVQVIDESSQRGDKKLALAILDVTRGLLKPTRQTVFSATPLTLVDFNPGPYNEIIEQSDKGLSKIKLIDMYSFIIQ